MKPLLASLPEMKNALPSKGPALLLDVDGTISAIAPTPQEATVDPGCKQALQALASNLPLVAAISGRPAAEVAAMVGVAGLVYAGNHGLEQWRDGEVRIDPRAAALAGAVDSALRQLQARLSLPTLQGESSTGPDYSPRSPRGDSGERVFDRTGRQAGLPGLVYEHKGLTAAVHYRLSPDPVQARRAILKAARDVARPLPVQVHEGRMVVELRPAIKADKGTAVAALLEEYQLARGDASRPAAAFYLGDDLTDVDAFRALHGWAEQHARWGAAVAVLSAETPPELREEGDFWLEGVEEVRLFLVWLTATYRTCLPAEVS